MRRRKKDRLRLARHAKARACGPFVWSRGVAAAAPYCVLASALRSIAVLLTSTGLPLQLVERLRQLEVLGGAELGQRLGRLLLLGLLLLELLARFLAGLLAGLVLLLVGAAQVLLQVGLAHAQRGEHVALGGFVEPDVGHDALGLDRAAAGRVVARGGDLQRGVGRQRAHGLHRALAEGLRAHDGGALVVLQRAGDDLAGRGRAFVDQHHQRHGLDRRGQALQRVGAAAAQVVLGRGLEGGLGLGDLAVGGDHRHVARQEGGRDAPPRRRAGRPGRCAGRAPGP